MGSLTSYVYSNSIAKALWDTIDSYNQSFSKVILSLSESAAQHPKEYQKMVKYLSTLQSVQVTWILVEFGLSESNIRTVLPSGSHILPFLLKSRPL